jgi:hypothetical protein
MQVRTSEDSKRLRIALAQVDHRNSLPNSHKTRVQNKQSRISILAFVPHCEVVAVLRVALFP